MDPTYEMALHVRLDLPNGPKTDMDCIEDLYNAVEVGMAPGGMKWLEEHPRVPALRTIVGALEHAVAKKSEVRDRTADQLVMLLSVHSKELRTKRQLYLHARIAAIGDRAGAVGIPGVSRRLSDMYKALGISRNLPVLRRLAEKLNHSRHPKRTIITSEAACEPGLPELPLGP